MPGGMLMLVVGPSGAGKDTLLSLARESLQDDARIRFVRRQITRPPDRFGEDHEALDQASFEMRRAAGAYALWWEAHGLRYGIPAEIVLDLDAGCVVVANVSRGVIAQAARRFPVRVVEVTARPDTLAARLHARGREAPADIADRLRRSTALPPGIEVIRIDNDGTPEAGAAALVTALLAAAESARPARSPLPLSPG